MDGVTIIGTGASFCWHPARSLVHYPDDTGIVILIGLEPFYTSEVGHNVKRLELVARVQLEDEQAAGDWWEYAQRLAGAWNACILAANLTGRDPNCPPLILADALEDVFGPCPLARDLRGDFGADVDLSLPAGTPFPFPEMPVLSKDDCKHLDWLKSF